MIGRTYLERGRPVTVLVQWRRGRPAGPRNVLRRLGMFWRWHARWHADNAGTPKKFTPNRNDTPVVTPVEKRPA